jgi:galactokinase
MNINELKKKFTEVYGGSDKDLRVFSSPGRVNMIGEHTDYNGGYVFPAALTLSSTLIIRKREDRKINMMATDLMYLVEAEIDKLDEYRDLKWGNYQLGVADTLMKAGYHITGCDMLFHDTVPLGSGLSSSAAIEVVTALALATLGQEEKGTFKKIDMVEMAKLSQKAEHEYIGVKCGLMDQFASAMGKKDYAIFLNCKDITFRHIPLKIKGYKIVLGNTKVKRSLATVKYNERREECEKGLSALQENLPDKTCLGDISIGEFEANKNLIKDEIIRKRVRHIVYEDARVLKTVDALSKNDIITFGELMNRSHDSLRDLYEVTGNELDIMVEEARKVPGVMGSRMTGAGFGGCTVSIVKDGNVDEFIQTVKNNYDKRTGLESEFYISEIGDGGREIK